MVAFSLLSETQDSFNNLQFIDTNFKEVDSSLLSKSDDSKSGQLIYGRIKSGLKNKNRSIFVSLLVISILIPTSVVNAGFYSFVMEKFFSDSSAVFYSRGNTDNSQSMELLKAAINPNPNPPKGGGGITIVDGVALVSDGGLLLYDETSNSTVSQSGEISVYVVRAGDSLSQIAEMFNVTVNTIRWTNDIGRNGNIQIGQTLVILPVSGVRYIVKDGDTVSSIAKKYDGDQDEIIEFNNLNGIELTIGEEIIIPHGIFIEAPVKTTAKYASSPAQGTNGPAYVGYYMRPVNGGIKTQGLHGYNAIDIGAAYGTPILASAAGEVVVSKYLDGNPWFGGYGNYIVLKHSNGTQTVYAHLSQNLVQRGWNVQQGQVIGYMGSTGRSTGNHVHFEIRGAQNPF